MHMGIYESGVLITEVTARKNHSYPKASPLDALSDDSGADLTEASASNTHPLLHQS